MEEDGGGINNNKKKRNRIKNNENDDKQQQQQQQQQKDDTVDGTGGYESFLQSMAFATMGQQCRRIDQGEGEGRGGGHNSDYPSCPCCLPLSKRQRTERRKLQLGVSLLKETPPNDAQAITKLYEWVLEPPHATIELQSVIAAKYRMIWIRQLPIGTLLWWKTTTTASGGQQWQTFGGREGDVYLIPAIITTATSVSTTTTMNDTSNSNTTTATGSMMILGFKITRDGFAPPDQTENDDDDDTKTIIQICELDPQTLLQTPEEDDNDDANSALELSWHNVAINVAREAFPLFQNENPKQHETAIPYQRLSTELTEMLSLGLDLAASECLSE